MKIHYRFGDIEVEARDYVFTNGFCYSHFSKHNQCRFPLRGYSRGAENFGKTRFNSFVKEGFLEIAKNSSYDEEFSGRHIIFQYWKFTEKALLSDEVK